jgi:Spy/CpxP family protein refolding chaperone
MMKSMKYAAIAALIVSAAAPAMAQQRDSLTRPPRPPRVEAMPGPMGGGGIETALRMREQLKLTDSQVAQLETLRKEVVAQRQAQAREMIELQSRVAAGQVKPEEMREQHAQRRDAMRTALEQRRARVEKILTDDQREQIGRAQRQHMRSMQMRGARRGMGPGRGPGMGPGRGQGMGPGGMRPGRGFRQPMPGRYYWF